MNQFGQLHAVHRPRHLHIGEQHLDLIGAGLQHHEANIRVRDLQNLEACLSGSSSTSRTTGGS